MREAADMQSIVKALGYVDEGEMLRDLYVAHEMSVEEIAKRIGYARGVIHRRLEAHAIPLRKRGGPNRTVTSKLATLPDEAFTAPHKLAKDLGMHYSTVYKEARRRGLCISALSPQPQSSTDTPVEVATSSLSRNSQGKVELTLSGIEEELMREMSSSSIVEDTKDTSPI